MLIQLKNKSWQLSEVVAKSGKEVIRVPLAVLGSWSHPTYKSVSFTQSKFDEIINNWKNNVCGYEPPLYLGHDFSGEKTKNVGMDSPHADKAFEDPAVAHLENIFQEGSVLYGDYVPVDDKALELVRKGSYRYSSSEIITNASSKSLPSEPIGTLLTGCALTNKPYLTGMPRAQVVQKFSDINLEEPYVFAFPISKNMNTEEQTIVEEKSPEVVEAKAAPAEVVSSPNAEQFKLLSELVKGLQVELNQTKEKLASTESKLKNQELEVKLSEVSKLNLSAPVKEQYTQMLKSGTLTEQQEQEMRGLFLKLSEDNKSMFSEQQGEVVTKQEAEIINPFQHIIERNAAKAG